MPNDFDTGGIVEEVETSDLMYLSDEREAPLDCIGRCDVCDERVMEGEPFTRDPEFAKSLFCKDCGSVGTEPSVAELAGRMAR